MQWIAKYWRKEILTKLGNTSCALIPINISLLEEELQFFNVDDYQKKNIPVDNISDENNELDGDTEKLCGQCNGEIFNVYLKKKTKKKGMDSICPECAKGLPKNSVRANNSQISFKFYNQKYLEHMIDCLKQTMSDLQVESWK